MKVPVEKMTFEQRVWRASGCSGWHMAIGEQIVSGQEFVIREILKPYLRDDKIEKFLFEHGFIESAEERERVQEIFNRILKK